MLRISLGSCECLPSGEPLARLILSVLKFIYYHSEAPWNGQEGKLRTSNVTNANSSSSNIFYYYIWTRIKYENFKTTQEEISYNLF